MLFLNLSMCKQNNLSRRVLFANESEAIIYIFGSLYLFLILEWHLSILTNYTEVSVYLHAGKAILGGEVVIGVSYVGVPVHTENIDLCKEVKCPVANGNFVISHTQTLPVITPPVSFISSLSYKFRSRCKNIILSGNISSFDLVLIFLLLSIYKFALGVYCTIFSFRLVT